MKNKKALELDLIGWWLLALAVLIVVAVGYSILTGKGTAAINFIQDLFRFK